MELVDTHCHLHFDTYGVDPDTALASAKDAGVTRVICVGCTLADSRAAVRFAKTRKNVWSSIGFHPHESKDFMRDESVVEEIQGLATEPEVVAIGEIGLDYYHINSPKSDQLRALGVQIEIGSPTGLPFIFHVRDAWEDFWPLFDKFIDIRGVVHSFSANTEQLDKALERGLYIGLNGIMTFTKDEAQLRAAKQVPLDRLLLETDAPFLTPKPFRGQVCEPKHIAAIAEFLAELRGESVDQIARASTANALKLFKLDSNV